MLTKDKSTPENREYWEFIEKTAAEVRTWPDWKTGRRTMPRQPLFEMTKAMYQDNPTAAIKAVESWGDFMSRKRNGERHHDGCRCILCNAHAALGTVLKLAKRSVTDAERD